RHSRQRQRVERVLRPRPPAQAHGAGLQGVRPHALSAHPRLPVVHGPRLDVEGSERARDGPLLRDRDARDPAGVQDATPYAVVLVELDEQRGQPTPDEALRIITNLVKPDFTMEDEAKVAIGARVRVVFQDLADHFALPQFTLSEEAPSGRVWRLGA